MGLDRVEPAATASVSPRQTRADRARLRTVADMADLVGTRLTSHSPNANRAQGRDDFRSMTAAQCGIERERITPVTSLAKDLGLL